MLTFLIDEHPGGWSNIVEADFALPPNMQVENKTGPQCYCHGRLSSGAYPVELKTIFEQNMAWTYAFDVQTEELWVIYNDQETKQLDAANVIRVSLTGDEPDWKRVRCGTNLERCDHLAVEHFPALANTPAGRMRGIVYAKNAPLSMQDAHAVYSGGIRFELTGKQKGGNGAFHAWGLAKGKAGEGADLIIGREDHTVPGGYYPSEGVEWVFAPRLGEDEETRLSKVAFLAQHGVQKKKLLDIPAFGDKQQAPDLRQLVRLGKRELVVAVND
jgi:hypothetical protein